MISSTESSTQMLKRISPGGMIHQKRFARCWSFMDSRCLWYPNTSQCLLVQHPLKAWCSNLMVSVEKTPQFGGWSAKKIWSNPKTYAWRRNLTAKHVVCHFDHNWLMSFSTPQFLFVLQARWGLASALQRCAEQGMEQGVFVGLCEWHGDIMGYSGD